MTTVINEKIVDYSVIKQEEKPLNPVPPKSVSLNTVQQMHEQIERSEILHGKTYKIKNPIFDHALYITINDIVLNPGTEHEQVRPFEIFINSKNMEHFQWVIALTRVISAVFRKGGDVEFLVEELRSVFDPKGGYFKKGGRYVPSLVAEIGDVIAQHLCENVVVKREFSKKETFSPPVAITHKNASICPKCNQFSYVKKEGCAVCLECGHSLCG